MNGSSGGIAASRQFIAEHCKIKDFAMEPSIPLSCGGADVPPQNYI